MMNDNFELKILDLHWITDTDDPNDLCAHGHLFLQIGNEIVADQNTFDITLSATALHLMRTIKNNYKKDDYASQLLPCCGHFLIADDKEESVDICGCPSGFDWTIIHTDDNKIKHITDKGEEATIKIEDYKKIVLDFADQVEDFYKSSLPKIILSDDFDRKGYLTFWREWRNLRDEWKL